MNNTSNVASFDEEFSFLNVYYFGNKELYFYFYEENEKYNMDFDLLL